jgi:HSP20 family protein
MSIEIWRPRGASVSPWRAFEDMERAVDEMLGMRGMAQRRTPQEREWMPSVEMFEKDNTYIIKAELPGVKPGEIDVSVTDHNLTIKGEKQASRETKNEDYYLSEVSYGSFMRSIPLPENVDADRVEASFEDGMLEITVPKMALTQPRKVAVSARKNKAPAAVAAGKEGMEHGQKKGEEQGSQK